MAPLMELTMNKMLVAVFDGEASAQAGLQALRRLRNPLAAARGSLCGAVFRARVEERVARVQAACRRRGAMLNHARDLTRQALTG